MQIVFAIPQWGFEVAHSRHPLIFDKLFLSELTRLDAAYASDVQSGLQRSGKRESHRLGNMSGRLLKRSKSWRNNFRQTLWLTVIGLIPIVGPIVATFGHWFLISETMGHGLLQVCYGADPRRMATCRGVSTRSCFLIWAF
jgi:hypothetical protein